jgi:hypothetical protein
MPGVRQTLTGLPPQTGPTAFMPLRASTPSVFDISRAQGTPEDIVGQPGTMGVPAPYPEQTFIAMKGDTDVLPSGLSASQYMPPRWYPTIYYRAQHLFAGIGGVRVYSDNMLPVPSVDPRGLPVNRPPIGPQAFAAEAGLTPTAPARPNNTTGLGRFQIPWPRRMPDWGG